LCLETTVRRLLTLLLTTCLLAGNAASTSAAPDAAPLPSVAVGRLERLASFPSRHVDARHVDVWLPRDYRPGVPHAVLYMHDGQMLFDAGTTWNRQAWRVQDAVQRLIDAGRIPPTLVVGVWNNGKYRHSEYFPERFLGHMPAPLRQRFVQEALQGQPRSDAYLRFLVEELKPAIDARYATRRDAAHTLLMGASMGGLISVYAMSEYPAVFGGAAGLSTHWVGTFKANAAIPLAGFNYLRERLADPATHRLYQDHGTTELDALYAPYQLIVNDLAREAGYVDGANFETRVFTGTGHNETAWAERLEVPLLFLLGRR
jgi:enterochelin esterase-like enzyme